jgi:hypothetical protein
MKIGMIADESTSSTTELALVERICRSTPFRKSARLRELLVYLCQGAPRTHGVPSEREIGVAVFHRAADYDTNVEAIVRVQVSQLRRKLELYFLAEGRDEPIVVEIPKGGYLPIFRRRAPAGARGTPRVDLFWAQFLEADRTVQVFASDGSVGMVADALGRRVTLAEHSSPSYPRALVEGLGVGVETLIVGAAARGVTTESDARAAVEIAGACRDRGGAATIVSSRDLGVQDLDSNAVLLGHPRSSPWLELFSARLTFVPSDAEPDHLVVAHLPLANDKRALILVGARTDVAARTMVDETALAEIQAQLEVPPESRIPFFELLLRMSPGETNSLGRVVAQRNLGASPTDPTRL